MSSSYDPLVLTLWALVVASEGCLLLLLFWRRAWRDNAAFTGFIAFCVLRSCLLIYARFVLENSTAYVRVGWGAYALQSVLLIALVLEVVRIVLGPYEALPRGTLGNLVLATFTVAFLTVAFTLRFPGSEPSEWITFLRAMDQGVSWTLWGIFVTILVFARVLGIPWNHRVYGIVVGFVFYLSVDVVIVTMTTQRGQHIGSEIWPLDMLAFLVACFTWTYCFARAEVPRAVPTMIEVRRLATVLSQYVILIKSVEVKRNPMWQPQGNDQLNSGLGGKHDAA
jgi:hypothetical protein